MLRIASMWRLTQWMVPVTALGALALTGGGAVGQERGLVRPDPPVLREAVSGMPRGERQEIRVLTATLKPGDKTVFHTHRFPVTVYILEGALTLEMEGRARGDNFGSETNVPSDTRGALACCELMCVA